MFKGVDPCGISELTSVGDVVDFYLKISTSYKKLVGQGVCPKRQAKKK